MWEVLKEPMWFWLIMAVIFLIVELLTLGLTTIWFTGGAVAALISVVFGGGWLVSAVVFFAVSIAWLMLVRPIARKSFNGKRTKTNAESLIGKTGIVFEEIDNINSKGRITVLGQEWAAGSISDDAVIPKGTKVKVLSIKGVKLIVEELN